MLKKKYITKTLVLSFFLGFFVSTGLAKSPDSYRIPEGLTKIGSFNNFPALVLAAVTKIRSSGAFTRGRIGGSTPIGRSGKSFHRGRGFGRRNFHHGLGFGGSHFRGGFGFGRRRHSDRAFGHRRRSDRAFGHRRHSDRAFGFLGRGGFHLGFSSGRNRRFNHKFNHEHRRRSEHKFGHPKKGGFHRKFDRFGEKYHRFHHGGRAHHDDYYGSSFFSLPYYYSYPVYYPEPYYQYGYEYPPEPLPRDYYQDVFRDVRERIEKQRIRKAAADAKKIAQQAKKAAQEQDRTIAHLAYIAEAFLDADYQKALLRAKRAVKAVPDNPTLLFAQSQSLFANAEYDQAAGVLRTTLGNIDPEKPQVFYFHDFYPDEDILTEQIDSLTRSAQKDHLNADLQLLLGYQLLGLRNFDQALEALQKARDDDINKDAATLLIEVLEKTRRGADSDVPAENATEKNDQDY